MIRSWLCLKEVRARLVFSPNPPAGSKNEKHERLASSSLISRFRRPRFFREDGEILLLLSVHSESGPGDPEVVQGPGSPEAVQMTFFDKGTKIIALSQ